MSDGKPGKKLVRVRMTYDDGTDVAVSDASAQEWLAWVNSYLVFQQVRTGRADSRAEAFRWEPVVDEALDDPHAEAVVLNRRLRALLSRAGDELGAVLDGICRECGNAALPCYCARDD